MIRWVHTTDKLVFEAAYSTNTLAETAERQVIPPGHLGIGRLSASSASIPLWQQGKGRLRELTCLVLSHPAQDWPGHRPLVNALFYLIWRIFPAYRLTMKENNKHHGILQYYIYFIGGGLHQACYVESRRPLAEVLSFSHVDSETQNSGHWIQQQAPFPLRCPDSLA